MVSLHDRIRNQDYLKILFNEIHPMVAVLFPEGNAIPQDDNAPINTAKIVSEWHEEHSSEVEHLPGHHTPQILILLKFYGTF